MDYERELNRLIGAYKKAATIKDCFHHKKDECQGKIKQSHSVQRNGRLSIIEAQINGNNSIYTFTSGIPSKKNLIESLIPIGKKEASTFFGFCDYHDTKLFSPIENYAFDGSDMHCFFHSYRSFAHSHHKKMEEFKAHSNENSEYTKFIKLVNSDMDRFLRMEGLKMSINDSRGYKQKLDEMLEEQRFDGLEYLVYEKEGLYPFAVSSQMSPRTTYSGKSMNDHLDPDIPWSQPMITFLPDIETTFVILAAFPEDRKSVLLLNELDRLNNLKLERAITSLIIANCENTFFSPLFWNFLSKKEQRLLLDEFALNTLMKQTKFFHSKFNFFDHRYEYQNLVKNTPSF